MTFDFDDILAKLPHLSHAEWDELEQKIAMLRSLNKSKRVKLVTMHEDFYMVLEKYVYSEKGIKMAPFSSFQNGKTYTTYEASIKILEDFTKRHFDGLNHVEKMKLYHIYCMLACNGVEDFTGTVSLNILPAYIGKIPELFNKGFPNYIKSNTHRALIKF